MDTLRKVMTEGEEVSIGSLGRFTVVTDLSGDKTVMFCSAKSLKQAVNAGVGIV